MKGSNIPNFPGSTVASILVLTLRVPSPRTLFSLKQTRTIGHHKCTGHDARPTYSCVRIISVNNTGRTRGKEGSFMGKANLFVAEKMNWKRVMKADPRNWDED